MSEGSIFHGTKFWLAQRIPSRSHFSDLVKKNGGTIVALDKRADVLIADHARQDAPPNSFSWRFIEESVKEGRRLDLETYRIGRPPSKPRPVASMEPSRNHRTPFSLADDVLLAAWVANNEKSGGNKLYQRLEVVYPHHSWQSWRDRWMKKLRLLPPEALERMAAEAPQYIDGLVTSTPEASHPQQAASESVSGPTSRPTDPAPPQGPSPRQSTQTSRHQAVAPPKRHGSPPYTLADDDVLEGHVRTMVEKGKMWNSKVIYEELAKQRPHHSSSSWQNRFTERWRRNEVDMRNWNSKRIEPPQSDSPQSSTISVRYHKTIETRSTPSGKSRPPEPSPSLKTPEEELKKARFYEDLDIWAETETETGRAPTIPRWHQIKQVKFELWDLYAAVTTQDCGISDVDWDLVAEEMKLNWIAAPEIPEVLEGCWDKYLSKFHEEISDFVFDTQAAAGIVADDQGLEEDDEGDSSEEESGQSGREEMEEVNASVGGGQKAPDIGGRSREAADLDSGSDDSEEDAFESPPPKRETGHRRHTLPAARHTDSLLPSSPPIRGRRRNTRAVQSSPTLIDLLPPPLSVLKRKRASRQAEIPSTPDALLDTRLARLNDETPTRKRRKLAKVEGQDKPSNQSLALELGEREMGSEAEDTAQEALQVLVRTPNALGIAEPETIMRTTIRTKTTTTAITTESLPGSSPHAARPSSSRPLRSTAVDQHRELPPPGQGDDALEELGEDEDEEDEPEEAEVVVAGDSADDLETEEEENNSEEVFAAIARFEALGYDRNVVVESLFWTSMDPDKALTVMKSFDSGYDIPQNKQGIWTPQDDKKLKAIGAGGRGTARYRNALIKKHGQALVDARRRFLADAEAIGLSFD